MEPVDSGGEPLAPRSPSALAVSDADYRQRRWRLVRDLLVFQAKLLVDGIKDLVFAPIALIAAIYGLVAQRDDPGRSFYMLLRWGHDFDRWVNLFGTSEPPKPPALPPTDSTATLPLDPGSPTATPGAPPRPSATVDAYADRIEQVLVDQYRRGGLTAKAKDAIDRALDSIQERRPPDPPH